MTTTDLPPIPEGVDVAETIRYVNDHAPRMFLGTTSDAATSS